LESLIQTTIINAPFGTIKISANEACVIDISVNSKDESESEAKDYDHLILAVNEMQQYLDGSLLNFSFPMAQDGTIFQQQCWDNLCTIPYGKTISYLQQAKNMNNPLGIRAIASSNGKNKIAIAIPCHRVIGTNGSLTGYAGGLEVKKWLLQHEARFSGALMQGELF
jgi:methylated-DNA-[protein]-cysteine S-methyltransferase